MPPGRPAVAAAAAAATASGAGGGAGQLFSLLRSILRLHRRKLPPPMRGMGDAYVLDEFRRHLKGKTSEAQWRTFAAEWRQYAAMLGASAAPPGDMQLQGVLESIASGHEDMTDALLAQLTPEQQQQLARLQKEARALRATLLGQEGEDGGGGSGGISGSGVGSRKV